MSSASLGLVIEILVALLLVMTIGYCAVLNSRLKGLRANEHILRSTIGELLAATEIAERAIIGLKATTREAERALGQKLRDAQNLRNELHQLTGGAPLRIQASQTQIVEQRPPAIRQEAAPITRPLAQPITAAKTIPAESQQVATALRGLERALAEPDAPAAQKSAAQDFRVFTRSAFSSRTNG